MSVNINHVTQTISGGDSAALNIQSSNNQNVAITPNGTGLATITNGQLQTDLDANGQKITNLPASGTSLDVNDAAPVWYVQESLVGLTWKPPVTSTINDPPAVPTTGDRYIVGSAPTGAWIGFTDYIAEWNGVSWDLEAPEEGWAVAQDTDNSIYIYNATTGGEGWIKIGSTTGFVSKGATATNNTLVRFTDVSGGGVIQDSAISQDDTGGSEAVSIDGTYTLDVQSGAIENSTGAVSITSTGGTADVTVESGSGKLILSSTTDNNNTVIGNNVGQTTDATPLNVDLTIPTDGVWAVELTVAGALNDESKVIMTQFAGMVKNSGGTAALYRTGFARIDVEDDNGAAAASGYVVATPAVNGTDLRLTLTGAAAETVNWNVSAKLVQIVM